jgi:toxin ParE1/3/4
MRFLDAVEDTIRFLTQSREAGQRCNFASDMAEGIRVWPANGFRNPLIFYRPMNEGVEIVRVLHGARDIESLFHEGKEP